jgi:predicted amidophosphoribosyltransferase
MEFEEVFHFSATFLAGAGVACMTLGSLDNTRSRETCEFCRNPLDPDVNFCPVCGLPVQEKFDAGTPSPREYAGVSMCRKGHWYNHRIVEYCPLCLKRTMRPLFSTQSNRIKATS